MENNNNIKNTEGQFVNLTPHDVVVIRHGERATYPSVGVARVTEEYELTGYIDGVAMFNATYGEITGLPAPQEGVFYVVSAPLKDAAKKQGRTDTCSPAKTVRDPATGHVLYAEGLLW